jgi:HEAT repeat protein
MGKQGFDKKMEAIDALRSAPDVDHLRKALKGRNNFLVSKAAVIAGELAMQALISDLAAAFDRFMTDPVKSDPKCWAKNAIAKSLKDMACDDAALFLRGLKHIQLEPSYGRPEDSAQTLRGTCAMALVACPLPRFEILTHLVDALAADPAKSVRMDAARAIAQIPGLDSLLLLRLKTFAGDQDAEVTGQCLMSLLDIDPKDYIPFVANFLNGPDPDVRLEAAAALGECHDPQATATLIENYQTNPSDEVKRAILLSLGASRQPTAAEFLLSVVATGRQHDAIAAIGALAAGRFRDDFRERVQVAVKARGDAKLTATFEKEFSK